MRYCKHCGNELILKRGQAVEVMSNREEEFGMRGIVLEAEGSEAKVRFKTGKSIVDKLFLQEELTPRD